MDTENDETPLTKEARQIRRLIEAILTLSDVIENRAGVKPRRIIMSWPLWMILGRPIYLAGLPVGADIVTSADEIWFQLTNQLKGAEEK